LEEYSNTQLDTAVVQIAAFLESAPDFEDVVEAVVVDLGEHIKVGKNTPNDEKTHLDSFLDCTCVKVSIPKHQTKILSGHLKINSGVGTDTTIKL